MSAKPLPIILTLAATLTAQAEPTAFWAQGTQLVQPAELERGHVTAMIAVDACCVVSPAVAVFFMGEDGRVRTLKSTTSQLGDVTFTTPDEVGTVMVMVLWEVDQGAFDVLMFCGSVGYEQAG